MKCSCGRHRPLVPNIVGIQNDCRGVPSLILWNCRCGSTRGIRWDESTEPMRAEARLVELSRYAGSELMMGRG